MPGASIPPERLAEAGVWVARLHGDDRDDAVEAAFRQWLQAHPLNSRAFELCTEVWEDSLSLRRIVPLATQSAPRVASRLFRPFVALAATLVAALVLGFFLLQPGGVSTGVGEQRLLTLKDGTRVFLNTATRVVVRYDKSVRRVDLEDGEALFDVAKQFDRPFLVQAGSRRIRALGTSFVVRRDDEQTAVTLVEGRVMVTSEAPLPPAQSQGKSANDVGAAGITEAFTLAPGQRLTFAAGKKPKQDTPSLDKAIAWRRGQVVLDDTPLSSAVAEMNRYSSVKLVIERPDAGALLINGLFQVGDSASFAKAVAGTYGLVVVERQGTIVLSGAPAGQAPQPP